MLAGLFVSAGARAQQQDAAQAVAQALVGLGFENVAATAEGDRIVATYENRRYRYEARAVWEAAEAAMPLVGGAARLTLVPRRHGIPLRSVTIPADAYRAFRDEQIDRDAFLDTLEERLDVGPWREALAGAPRRRSSLLRFDFVVAPQFAVQFGSYNDAVQTQLGVAPELTATLLRGLQLRLQWIFPIQNELDEDGDYVRPRWMTLNQTVRLPGNTFVAATLGYFTANRYGVDVEARTYLAGGRFAVGGRAGYTGLAAYRLGTWRYTDPDRWTGRIHVDAHVPRFALLVRASAERFIFGDDGLRVEVRRAFGETHIGFWGLASNSENNAGVTLSIPLFPGAYTRPMRLRPRPARTFDWEYRYRDFPLSGRRYRTGQELDRLWDGIQPTLLGAQLRRTGGAW